MRKNRHRKGGTKSGHSSIDFLLNEARKTRFGGNPFNDPEKIKRGILSGMYTRERACDGKARFSQYAHAEKALKDIEARGYADWKPMDIYACPFCAQFHFATKKPT